MAALPESNYPERNPLLENPTRLSEIVAINAFILVLGLR
jgi:hypothetical protein